MACAADSDTTAKKGCLLLEATCIRRHAIALTGKSPLKDVPPFRDTAVRHDLADLKGSLSKVVATEHPLMPRSQMTLEKAHALAIVFLSLVPVGHLRIDLEDSAQPRATAGP